MEAITFSLIVECFKLDDKFAKGKLGLFQANDRNGALVDRPDAKNELAEVLIILVGEDTVKDARAEAVNI